VKEIARAASTRGAREDGRPGLLLRRVKPGSALAGIGLIDGDVVKNVNGFDFRDPDQALDAFRRLRKAARLDFAVVRGGAPLTIAVKVR
jgi:general secretion pathway protein C